jgi:hypothetical protein
VVQLVLLEHKEYKVLLEQLELLEQLDYLEQLVQGLVVQLVLLVHKEYKVLLVGATGSAGTRNKVLLD